MGDQDVVMDNNNVYNVETKSDFTGGAFANFFIGLLTGIVTILTLGLAYPAMLCWKLKWEQEHTYINGKHMIFDGKASQIYGKFILWLFLSIITVGIYGIFVMPLNIIRWTTQHTHFEGEAVEGGSKFDGSIWGLIGTRLVGLLVTILTLTLGQWWAHCYMERWYKKHTVIDNQQLKFDGTGTQFFGKQIGWILLTIITLGIYSFWLIVKTKKWTAKHTILSNPEAVTTIANTDDDVDSTDSVENGEDTKPEQIESSEKKNKRKKPGAEIFTDVATFFQSLYMITFPLLALFLMDYNGVIPSIETGGEVLFIYVLIVITVIAGLFDCISVGLMIRYKDDPECKTARNLSISNMFFFVLGVVIIIVGIALQLNMDIMSVITRGMGF